MASDKRLLSDTARLTPVHREPEPLGGSGVSPHVGAVGTALQAIELAGQAMELAGLAARAAGYAANSKAPNTQRAYASDWAHFTHWCELAGLPALPAEGATIALYLTWASATLSVSTLRRRLACIAQAHHAAGQDNPCRHPACRSVWAGISRKLARPPHQKTPLVVAAMRLVLAELDDSPRGARDRAILLLGWGGALRRSEIVALDQGDVSIADEGLVLTIRRGKTLAPGESRLVGIPKGPREEADPVRAFRTWWRLLPDEWGPLFRSVGPGGQVSRRRLDDKHVARLVKRVAARAGLEGDYSGHSLRAGLATSAAAAGASERSIMLQTGHKSVTIARGYIRPASLFQENAAAIAAL